MHQSYLLRITITVLLTSIVQLALSQCSIENLSVSIVDCVNDNNAGLIVDFQSETPSTLGYQISTQLGFEVVTYNQIPYTLTVSGNCITDYMVTVTDLSDQSCEDSMPIGIICCDVMCSVAIDIQQLQCLDNDSILVFTDFEVSEINTDSIDIYTNNNYISTVPKEDGNSFILPELGPLQTMTACVQGTECCDTVDILSPCECNIFNIHTAVTSCDNSINSYYLRVDFETTKPSSDSFTIGRIGNFLGVHAYEDLPIRVGPFGFDENDDDLFINDQVDAFCFGFISHQTLDSCEAVTCILSDLEIETDVDCSNSGNVVFHIKFNTSVESEGFNIKIDGTEYGPYEYGESSYSVGPIAPNGSSNYTVEIIDLEMTECTIESIVSPLVCDCDYSEISVSQLCNEDSLLAVILDFIPTGYFSDSFSVTTVVNSKRYAYSDLPITINDLPSEIIVLEVNDLLNPLCELMVIEELNCIVPCSITDFEVELDTCIELGVANMSFTFAYDNIDSDSVALMYDGNLIDNYEILDTAKYIIPLLNIDCELDFNMFTLSAIGDSDCFAEFAMPNIDCCTSCNISNVVITSTCLDDMSVNFEIDFDYNGDSTDIFEIVIADDFFGPYNYSQVPLVLSFTALSPGDYSYNLDFSLCQNEGTIQLDCDEECIIDNISVDSISCIDGEFNALLDFDFSESQDSFTIMTNDIFSGNFAVDDLPILIGPYEGDNLTEYIFTINILGEPNCNDIFNLGVVECLPNSLNEFISNEVRWIPRNNGVLIQGVASFNNYDLIDIQGRVLQSKPISSDQLHIDIESRPTGLYFVRLRDTQNRFYTIKIIL